MKKLLLLCALGISLCANAQLTVVENGQVQMGDVPSNLISSTADLTICNCPVSDSNISMSALLKAKLSTGSIAFGAAEYASISGGGMTGLLLSSHNMIEFNVGNTESVVLLNSIDKSFTSKFNMKAPSFLTTEEPFLSEEINFPEGFQRFSILKFAIMNKFI